MARVLLIVTGSIAAYKSVTVMRYLQGAGHEVAVLQTEMSKKFVGTMTFAAFAQVLGEDSAYPHLDYSRTCDLIVVAPATANIIAKMAAGIADDLVSTTLLGFSGPVVVAPAMNMRMYANPATTRNIKFLCEAGVKVLETGEGELACGDYGQGRMLSPEDVVAAALDALPASQEDESE